MISGHPIFVTGATGKVGSLTVPLLRAQSAGVRALTREAKNSETLAASGAEAVVGDVGDPSVWEKSMEGCAALLLISPAAADMAEVQCRVVEAAKRSGVGFIVKISGVGADPQSPVNLSRMHGQIESAIVATGVPFCFLRPYGFMQNLLGMAALTKKGGAFPTCRTDGQEATIDVRDIAAVAAKVLTTPGHSGKTYDLSGPEALTVDEIAALLSAASGTTVTPMRIPQDDYRRQMISYGVPDRMADDLIAWGNQRQPVTTGVRDVLGREATSLRQFLHDHANLFRA